jgi:D-glycerate 3-kinase
MDSRAFNDFLWTWIRAQVRRTPPAWRPLLVGLSAPQGAGKTAMTTAFCRNADAEGLRAVGLSIDDFYLPRSGQVALARRHAGNRYLQHRGYPGTHDVALGARVLAALKRLDAGSELGLPSYDRSAHGGLGDRREEGSWPRATGPLDLVILEGWMLGFAPVADDALADAALSPANRFLAAYAAWTSLLDAFIWLDATDPRLVVDWRAEAEADARAAGRGGMTDADVRAFASRFLPAYETWLPAMRRAPPVAGPFVRVTIGPDRLPVEPT